MRRNTKIICVPGIGPGPIAWEAMILPLDHTHFGIQQQDILMGKQFSKVLTFQNPSTRQMSVCIRGRDTCYNTGARAQPVAGRGARVAAPSCRSCAPTRCPGVQLSRARTHARGNTCSALAGAHVRAALLGALRTQNGAVRRASSQPARAGLVSGNLRSVRASGARKRMPARVGTLCCCCLGAEFWHV